MTEYKVNSGESKHRSLYIGLLVTMTKALIFAVVGWLVLMMMCYYVIGVYYTAPERQQQRREDYIEDLQLFVTENQIGARSSDRIGEWVRENSHVYLLVFEEEAEESLARNTDNPAPSPTARLSVYSGSRIDEELDRETLYADATSGGYYQVELADTTVTVALAEYTENFYYSTANIASLIIAVLTFVLSLVGYIRVLIQRIQRFKSDVTIVSEIDMNYVIVSEGADEIANLSGQVEQMRQRMLDHIKSEQEAREANTELITSISHDIRTPLTVLMGYIEMMKKHSNVDEVMESYISATESTALRMKGLADDMFKYSLAFGDAKGEVKLEEYDAQTLIDQLLSEHFVLMREMGYDIRLEKRGEGIRDGSILRTDAPNLMRIIDNVFSNMRKYADMSSPVFFTIGVEDKKLRLECKNKIRTDTEGAESNGIGLKTCVRLASLVADKFEHESDGEYFSCRLTISIIEPEE